MRACVHACVRACVRECVCVCVCVCVCARARGVCVELVLLFCIIVYYFKGMHECVYAFVFKLHYSILLLLLLFHYVRRLRTCMDVRYTNTILTV